MSLFKKIKTISETGIQPYEEGKKNYKENVPEIEDIAQARAKICANCELLLDEPINIFKVKDDRIPVLSNRMCGDCGCSSPYLLRQSFKICKKWQKSTNS